MRAPAFWWAEQAPAVARLLAPLGAIYGAITASRMRQVGQRAAVPVICIGNFTAGGAGKTQVALALGEVLKGLGASPAFLSRGHGGSHQGAPHRVDPMRDIAALTGDEPLLLAQIAPTFVSADRVAGAAACEAAGAKAIILDDGLQNPSLAKQLSLAVVDGRRGVGNGLCIPAGPLRAPLSAQWPAVDALIVIGAGTQGGALATQARQRGKAVFEASIEPDQVTAADLKGQRVLAFAGIGDPSKFYTTLRTLGAQVMGTRDFDDHHAFSNEELTSLRKTAADLGARLVTTQKDLMRISDRNGIEAVPVTLVFAEPQVFASYVTDKIGL